MGMLGENRDFQDILANLEHKAESDLLAIARGNVARQLESPTQ